MTEIRPCPFCGGETNLFHEQGFYGITGAFVQCRQCGAATKIMRGVPIAEAEEDAIKAWNRRYKEDHNE